MKALDGVKIALDAMLDGSLLISQDFEIVYANKVLEAEFGPEWRNLKCHEYFHKLDSPCRWCQNYRSSNGESFSWEWTCPSSGKVYDVHCTPLNLPDSKPLAFTCLYEISKMRSAERSIRKARDFYAALNQLFISTLNASSEGAFLNESCRILFRSCDLKGVWIGLLDSNEQVAPVASCGMDKN